MIVLPQSWHECALDDITNDISYGYTAKASPANGDARMLRITDIQENKVNWSTVPYCKISESEKDKYLLRKWDLVFARTGATVGKSFLIRDDAPNSVFASYLIRVRLIENGMAGYLSHFFDSQNYWQQITDFSAGIGQPNVNGSKLKSLRVPIAPMSEQNRIADKLDTVLARVDACRERLNRVPLILKRFRQSVLAAATSGQLTFDCRQESARVAIAGEVPITNTHWQEQKISTIFDVISGYAFKSEDFVETGVPVIKISNIQYGIFEEKNQEYLPKGMLVPFSRFVIKSGDLLLALTRPITNGQLKICRYPESALHGLLNQRVCKLQIKSGYIQRYFEFAFQSKWFIEQVQEGLSETLQPNLSPKNLGNFKVQVPPLAEQNEIVHRVETLFAFADRLEARLTTACATADRLTPALLAKAFRGELVPQDPNDEPATELLKRLAAAREPATKGKRSSKSVSTVAEQT